VSKTGRTAGKKWVVVTCASVTIPVRTRSARLPRNGCCHSSSDHGPETNSGRSDPNGGGAWVQGGDTLQHAVDPVSIPHDIGNQGVATGNDRKPNPQV